MAIRWRPLTCACILIYESVDEHDRFTGMDAEAVCKEHMRLPTAETIFAAVLKKNREAPTPPPED